MTRSTEVLLAEDAFATGDVAQGQRRLQQMATRETSGQLGLVLELTSPPAATVEAARHIYD